MCRPAPRRAYALQWKGKRGAWIDTSSIESKKTDALQHLAAPNATEEWKRELRRRRRSGAVKAVRVVVLTEEAYLALLGEKPVRPTCRDIRTLDLFDEQPA